MTRGRPGLEDGRESRRPSRRTVGRPWLYSWGDLTDEAYRREMADTGTMLAELHDTNKLVAFDPNRHVMVTMAENVDRATRPLLAELSPALRRAGPGQRQNRRARVD